MSFLASAGRETLFEEDLNEQEVEEELAPLTVQLAYVLGRLGRTAEAQELHDKVCVACVGVPMIGCMCVCV